MLRSINYEFLAYMFRRWQEVSILESPPSFASFDTEELEMRVQLCDEISKTSRAVQCIVETDRSANLGLEFP